MKKLFLSLLLMLPLCSFAQKGMQGVGFGVERGFGGNPAELHSSSSYGASFKYEYHLTDRFRLSANLNAMTVEGVKYYRPTITENSNTPDRPYLLYPNEVVYEVKDAYADASVSTATFGLDLHVFLNDISPLRTYLTLGGIIGISIDEDGYFRDFATGARVGLGFNWRLAYNWSLQLELPIKWEYMSYDRNYNFFDPEDNVIYYYNGDKRYWGYWGYWDDCTLSREDPNTNKLVSFGDYYTKLYFVQQYYLHYLAFTPQINIVYTF